VRDAVADWESLAVATDENFNDRILRGLQRRLPSLDAVRIQDTELEGADDPVWQPRMARVARPTPTARSSPFSSSTATRANVAVEVELGVEGEVGLREPRGGGGYG
jgi:hypothetical protein